MRFLLSILVPITSGHELVIVEEQGQEAKGTVSRTVAHIQDIGCLLTLFFDEKFEIESFLESPVKPCVEVEKEDTAVEKRWVDEKIAGSLKNGYYECKHGETKFATFSRPTPTTSIHERLLGPDKPLNADDVCRLIAKKYVAVETALKLRAAYEKRASIRASLAEAFRMGGEGPMAFRGVITRLLNCLKVQAHTIDVSGCCEKGSTREVCLGTSSMRLVQLAKNRCIPSSASDDEIVAFCVEYGITLLNWRNDLIKGFSVAKDKENYSTCYYSEFVRTSEKPTAEKPE
jgi:hypothetical protein